MPALFTRPETATRMPLAAEPVLKSWNAKSHPDQQRLRAYVEAVAAQVGLNDWPAQEPRVVELIVGLPQELAVDRSGRDLDNYLYPLVRHLGPSRIAAAFARKLHQHGSTIAVDATTPISEPPSAADVYRP
jgi:hypothetical protein